MSVEKINKRKELAKKLRKAIDRLLAPKEHTPALVLVPVKQPRRF
ncbi:hypothetical protein [Terrimonas ginsenosidimutans]|jgi:hypothetical protein|nr:hypothetical protein [Terrimonas ginsenosidimutans]